MGTRADFYVGIDPTTAEWIGSISHDGYPDGAPALVVQATSVERFRNEVEALHAEPEITSTRPEEGWPWPWDDSRTTDWAYAWTDDRGVVATKGCGWFTLNEIRAMGDEFYRLPEMADHEIINMRSRKADTDTILKKSGLMFLR